VMCTVRGDPGSIFLPAPSPGQFDEATLRWAIRSADEIAIWSAPFPELADEYAQWSVEAADRGARCITTIETTPDRASEWRHVADAWKPRKTRIRLFGEALLSDENLVARYDAIVWARSRGRS